MAEHKARKRFGQHFLHNQNVVQHIITAINPQKNQTIIEIGPGKGVLTDPLLEYVDKVHVLEVDRDLAQALAKKYTDEQKIVIHCIDALTYNFKGLGNQHLRIIGNLPYNISTPLIFYLLENSQFIEDMVFMLQEEIIDRMCAAPGNKDYGRLSVMVQANCHVEKLFTVNPDAFSPPPKVMSAIIKLRPYDKFLQQISDYPCFTHIVKQAFSQRRKTLKNCLKGMLGEQQIMNLGISPKARAETLLIDNFIQLANTCYEKNQ